MNTNYTNKLLPLTLKQLKSAQQQYKRRRIQTYNDTNYQFIYIVARIINISSFDFKLTDATDILDIAIIDSAIKKSTELIKGKYYRFMFHPRKNLPYGQQNKDMFAFQVLGIKRVTGNQVTKHLVECLTQRMSQFSHKKFIQEEQAKIQQQNIKNSLQLKLKTESYDNSASGSTFYKKNFQKMKQEIKKWCSEVKQFDDQKVFDAFKDKDLTVKEVKKIIQNLCQNGLIMDLGLVYQWIGEQVNQ